MTIQPGEEIEPGPRPGQLPESLKIIDGVSEWEAEFRLGVTGRLESAADVVENEDASAPLARLVVSGAGDVFLRSPEPRPIPPDASAAHLWVHLTDQCELETLPELLLLFSDGEERSLGRLDFSGWHLLHRSVSTAPGSLEGLILRGLFSRDEQELLIGGVGFETGHALPLDPIAVDTPSVYPEPRSMLPHSDEEVTTSVFKDEISFIFEARSLTAVVRYVYTPIEGSLSDIEVEINNAESIKIAESGGVTIEMGNRDWAADDEEVERHFVSCEQVGDVVEARWQWRRGDELADFLYRLSIVGKSLVVDIDGGNGKATGVDLGYTAGAIHPKLIRVPYFSFGDEDPLILCTSGVFISSLLDWYESSASRFFGPPSDNAHQELRINGGCRYEPASDDKRNLLKERWVLTVSRSFEEVLPSLPQPTNRPVWEPLRNLVWYSIPHLEASEEAYVNTYERLRTFKQRGLDHLLVNHPTDTWRDSDSGSSLALTGARTKGGDDALIEYLEAVRDLGYHYTLCTTLRDVTPTDPQWTQDAVARLSDGSYARTGPGRYLLKPAEAIRLAPAHARTLVDKYNADATFLAEHAASPPWDRVDFDSRVLERASFRSTLLAEQSALVQTADAAGGAVVGEGGSHWLYAGLLPGYSARLNGRAPCRQPLLVDFDLKRLHPLQVDAGIGEPSEFFGEDVAADEMHGRSSWFDRYLAATVAFGHAGCLPDVDAWGMPAVIKYYCMTQQLQTCYLGIATTSILYHHDGQLLETSEALVSGAYERSQVQVTYENGLQVHVNGSWSEEWEIDDSGITYRLPPASFHARGPNELLVYSADTGSGRIDFVQSNDYFYCDTRGQALKLGPLTVNGAALVRQQEWTIDVFPVDCQDAISIEPGRLWPERRMPKLRVLGYYDEDDEPQVISANLSDSTVVLDPSEGVYKYRITLPEWMVEPGQ